MVSGEAAISKKGSNDLGDEVAYIAVFSQFY